MTSLVMKLREEDRERVLRWVGKTDLVGKEIIVDISEWNAGKIGHFVCEIKEFIPATQPK